MTKIIYLSMYFYVYAVNNYKYLRYRRVYVTVSYVCDFVVYLHMFILFAFTFFVGLLCIEVKLITKFMVTKIPRCRQILI